MYVHTCIHAHAMPCTPARQNEMAAAQRTTETNPERPLNGAASLIGLSVCASCRSIVRGLSFCTRPPHEMRQKSEPRYRSCCDDISCPAIL